MMELMKRDFLSIRSAIKFSLLATIIVWLIIYLISLSLSIHAGYFIIVTLFMTVIISIELVENIFQQEHESGVGERMKQLPISKRNLILSRYIGSMFIVMAVFAVNLSLLSLNFLIFERDLSLFLSQVGAYFTAFHLTFFIVAIFLFVSFMHGYGKGVWAGRVAAIVWFFFLFFAPGMYWRKTLNISEAPPDQFLKMVPPSITILAILLFVLSYFLCLFMYNRRREGIRRNLSLLILLLASLAMFIGIGVHVESKVFQHNEAVISEMKVERVALDIFNVNEADGEPLYQILFNMEFVGPELEWPVMKETTISYQTPEIVSELTHLEDGAFTIAHASGSFLREESRVGDTTWFAIQESGPLLLSEEELAIFLDEFNEKDFQFVLQSPWLTEKEMKLDWHS